MNTIRRNLIVVLLFPPLTAALGGCQLVAWTVAQFAPPRTFKAQYKMPEGKKVLVFVDDLRRPVPWEPIKKLLTERINAELVEHKVAAEAIPYQRLEDLMHRTRDFNRLAISTVGEELGADLVLYVDIREFSLKENDQSPLWQGRMKVEVKVVQATDSGPGTLWPLERRTGYPVKYKDRHPSTELSDTHQTVVAKNLVAKMGRKIGRLFHDYKVPAKIFGDEDED